MVRRAELSGVVLDNDDAAIVKGMLARGDRQHDVAAWFGVNGGRIAEIATGAKFNTVGAATASDLPPPGPYLSGRQTQQLMEKLVSAKASLVHR